MRSGITQGERRSAPWLLDAKAVLLHSASAAVKRQ